MARTVKPYGQKPAYPVGTIAIAAVLILGVLVGLAADGRGGAVSGLLMVAVKAICGLCVIIGPFLALYLSLGKNRDTNAALLSLGLSVFCGCVLLFLLFTVRL